MTCNIHGKYDAKIQGVVFGREVWSQCPQCEEACNNDRIAFEASKEKHKIVEQIRRANIPKRFLASSFDEYLTNSSDQQRALRLCQAYSSRIDNVRLKGVSLVMCGRPGTGKTHLACAILRSAIEGGLTGTYSSIYELVSNYKATFGKDKTTTDQDIIDKYVSPGLLVLDEVGVQYGTDAEMVIISRVLNDRYNDVKPTILITNHSEGELAEFVGERVVDRMKDNGGALINFNWTSHRKRGVKTNA